MPDPSNALAKVALRLLEEVKLSYPARVSLEERNRTRARIRLAVRLRRESHARTVIDGYCRHWIENGVWPHMSVEEAIHVSDRVGEAFEFADWLDRRGFQHPYQNESELLDFFLIEAWVIFGLRRVQARLAFVL